MHVSRPEIQYRSTNLSTYDACMDWQATLYLDSDDEPSAPISGGHTDFLIIRLGEAPLHGILSMADDTPAFAPLFDGPTLARPLTQQFPDHVDTVLLVRHTYVEPALRGNDLGAWMLAEIVARMTSSTQTLVIGRQYPLGMGDDIVSRRRAERSLRPYWRKIGVVPCDASPEFWAQSTDTDALRDARAHLARVHSLELEIAPTDITGPNDTARPPKSGVQLIAEMRQ